MKCAPRRVHFGVCWFRSEHSMMHYAYFVPGGPSLGEMPVTRGGGDISAIGGLRRAQLGGRAAAPGKLPFKHYSP